jgi:hypothetical protein
LAPQKKKKIYRVSGIFLFFFHLFFHLFFFCSNSKTRKGNRKKKTCPIAIFASLTPKKTKNEIQMKKCVLRETLERIERKIESHYPTYCLRQSDFAKGTLRIKKPGIYKLGEDITFDPKPLFPSPNDPEYNHPAFSLGFFAAIAVESNDVIIEGNGHTLKQSEEHRLNQRFYANIELANAPFIPNQGPGTFSPPFVPAKRCIVRNIKLGLSAHHGIHGNSGDLIWIKDIRIREMEFIGIALNGTSHVIIENSNIGPNDHNLPVLGTLSNAIFAVQFADKILDNCPSNAQDLKYKRDALNNRVNTAIADILCRGSTKDPLFDNPERVADGLAAGIIIHAKGVATGAFLNGNFEGQMVSSVYIENTHITGLHSSVKETPAISTIDGTGIQKSVDGAVLQITDIVDQQGRYKGNTLSNLQIAIAKSRTPPQGVLNISKEIIDWACSDETLQEAVFDKGNFKYVANIDNMGHVLKGILGIRMDGAEHCDFHDVCIRDVKNTARSGTLIDGRYERSAPGQNQIGYHGADSIGINLSRTTGIRIGNVKCKDIESINGIAAGFRLLFDTKDTKIFDSKSTNIRTGFEFKDGQWLDDRGDVYTASLPNSVPIAAGLLVTGTEKVETVHQFRSKNIRGPVVAFE